MAEVISPQETLEAVEAAVDEIKRHIVAVPPERRQDAIECLRTWAEWHVPRVLGRPLPRRPISIREARLLCEMEVRFAANGCWLPGMRPPAWLRRQLEKLGEGT